MFLNRDALDFYKGLEYSRSAGGSQNIFLVNVFRDVINRAVLVYYDVTIIIMTSL